MTRPAIKHAETVVLTVSDRVTKRLCCPFRRNLMMNHNPQMVHFERFDSLLLLLDWRRFTRQQQQTVIDAAVARCPFPIVMQNLKQANKFIHSWMNVHHHLPRCNEVKHGIIYYLDRLLYIIAQLLVVIVLLLLVLAVNKRLLFLLLLLLFPYSVHFRPFWIRRQLTAQ